MTATSPAPARRRSFNGDRIFAPPPDSRPLWFRDRKARHTCRITGTHCDQAFRCQFSLAEPNPHGLGSNTLASSRARFEACLLANANGFDNPSICHTSCPRRASCPQTWQCWFRERFSRSSRPKEARA